MGAQLDGTMHSEDVQDFNTCIKVMAGPGAGKTHWLIGQIKYILAEAKDLGLSRKVGCITYTNKATENILTQVGANNNRLEVSTIHAFLYRNIIKPYFHLIAEEEGFAIDKLDGHDDTIITSYGFVTELMTANRMGMLVKHAQKSYELKQTVEDFRWRLTSKGITLQKTIRFPRIPGVGEKFVLAYKKKVWSEYGIMHHDDVLYFTYKLIEKEPRILNLLVARYPYLLIDEYQDSSSIQHWLFTKLAEKGSKITLIGDKAQSIYTFAGADIANIDRFTAPDIKTFSIEDNHRSAQHVVDFLNILRPDFVQKSLRDECFEKVTIVCGDSISAYQSTTKICGDEGLFALTWKNEDANIMKLGLEATGKKEDLLGRSSEWDSNSDRRKIVVNVIKGVENARQLIMDDAVKYTAKGFGLNTKHINQKKAAIVNMHALLKTYEEYCNGTLLDFFNKLREIDESIPKVSRGNVLEAYQKPYADYAKSVNYTDDNTHFITIHKSKGLGFDNVLLVFPEKEVALDFLLKTDLNQEDDDHRLYYVACSRAKNRLFINMPMLEDTEKEKLVCRFGEVIRFA
ncbi:MAG: ATP-dependent helicase [Prevotella sp.]|nr:ATP-dependent helicase [Prevotella sp.]